MAKNNQNKKQKNKTEIREKETIFYVDPPKKSENKFLKFVGFPFFIFIILMLIYGNGLKFEFTSCDDVDLIVDNYPFIKKTSNIPKAFKQSCFEIPGHVTEDKSYYRPILISSFIIDAQLDKPSYEGFPKPKVFHFTNILLHFLVCWILYRLLILLGINTFFSFLLALLFAVHPLHVMAVSWVPGRNDSLLGIFCGLYIFQIIKYAETKKLIHLIFCIISFLGALFTKESGLMLFPLGIIFLWAFEKDWKNILRNPIYLVGSFASIGLWIFARSKAMEGDKVVPTMKENIGYFIENLQYIPMHIGKYFFPFSLSVMPGVTKLNIILGIVSFVIFGYLMFKLENKKLGIFAILWVALFLAPTLILPKLPAYEHRNYIPLIGIIIIVPFLSFFNRDGKRQPSNRQIRLFLSLIISFSVCSFKHTDTFSDRWKFWKNATEDSPFAGTAMVNIGKLMEESGNNAEAKVWYGKALAYDSSTIKANNNYGAMLFVVDNNQTEGLKYFKRELHFYPTNTDAMNNIAIVYRNQGNIDSSIVYFEKCYKTNRVHYNALVALKQLYTIKENFQKAEFYGKQADAIITQQNKLLNQ